MLNMSSDSSIWIYWNELGIAETLHTHMICLCKQTKKRGIFAKKVIPYNNETCNAKEIIQALKTLPMPSDLNMLHGWIYVMKQIKSRFSHQKIINEADRLHGHFVASKLDLEGLGYKKLQLNFTPTPVESQGDINTYDHDEITKIAADYFKNVSQYPEHVCHFCSRQCYKDNSRNLTIAEQQARIFSDFDVLKIGEKVKTCLRCLDNVKKGKILGTYRKNLMEIPKCPIEIAVLTDAELQLISPVRAFQKIFNLRQGRGQHAVAGSCIYFAQSVEEVVEQLPLCSQEAGLAVVTENLEHVKKAKELEVRPTHLYRALNLLKQNNHLFRNIQIVPKSSEYLSLNNVSILNNMENVNSNLNNALSNVNMGVQNVPDHGVNIQSVTHFKAISNNRNILRGTFHQGSLLFSDDSRGTQCTANCAVFLAQTLHKDITTWTPFILDKILTNGDRLYRNVYSSLPETIKNLTKHLEVGDLMNTVFEMDDWIIKFEPDTDNGYLFSGLLNCALDSDRASQRSFSLSSRLTEFLQSQFDKAVITTRGYAMGIFKTTNHVYLFDPHSRSPTGRASCNGTSCVIEFAMERAASQIETLVCKTFDRHVPNNSSQRLNYQFTIQPMHISSCQSSMDVDINQNVDEPMDVCNETNIGDILGSQLNCVGGNNSESPMHSIQLNAALANENECPCSMEHIHMHANDHVEPDARNFISNLRQRHRYTVFRNTCPPIKEDYKDHLDELSFLRCYSYGTHGYGFNRPIPITVLDYNQTLLLSGDERFQTAEFLFYALNRVEAYKLSQMCNIVADLETEGEAQNVLKDETLVHLTLRGIRGSASYWKSYGGDLNAMIHQLRSPTLFLTVSFDDLNSLDSLNALWKAKNGYSCNVNPEMLDYRDKKKLLDEHPLAAARHFNLRLRKLLQLLKKKGKHIFGYKVANYAGRVEFQMRGSPHAHMLLWLENVPSFDTPEGRNFIEKNMSCSLNTRYADKVRKYQIHKCTATCYKSKENHICRFHFPYSPSTELRILDDEETLNNYGRSIILKRSENESMVNTYHPYLLNILLCNHDIQVITNAAGAAYYIAKYVSKNEPDKFRKEISEAISCATKSAHSSSRLKTVAFKFHNKREVSAQEAIYRLCHLPLHFSTVVVEFVPAFVKNRRLRYLRTDSLANGQIRFRTNIIEKYEMRPSQVSQLCLFEFAAMYEAEVRQDYERLDDNIDCEDDIDAPENDRENEERLVLRDRHNVKKGVMRKRAFAKIIKTPRFQTNELNEQLYSLLLLFYPFKEESVFQQFPDIKTAFETLKSDFRTHDHNHIIPSAYAEEFDRMLLRAEELLAREDDDLGDDDREYDNEVDLGCEEELDSFPNDAILNPHVPFSFVNFVGRYQSLNNEQRQVFDMVDKKVEEILKMSSTQPLRLFVTGGGGTGKSYLINTIHELIAQKLYQPSGPSIILCAPTGVAALNINASTLHSAFKLGIEKYTTASYKKLGSKLREALKLKYKHVKFVIVDEISMVSYQVLRMVNLRLLEIFGDHNPEAEQQPFADLNFIVFGDLFQLPPCHGNPVYKLPDFCKAEIDLWRLFKFVELNVNQRQSNNDPLLGICNRLRLGQSTVDDISILLSRQMENLTLTEQLVFNDAIRIFPTCKQVNSYNESVIREMEATGTKIFTITANDTFSDGPKAGHPLDENTKKK